MHFIWPGVKEKDVPVTSVTNGVHVPTWVAPQTASLYEKYIARDWLKKHDDPTSMEEGIRHTGRADMGNAPGLKGKLIGSIKERARKRWAEDRVAPEQAIAMGALLDTGVLTIAFSRRFTEYKRPALIMNDVGRLKQMLRNEFRPVQLIFAGKAHPNDDRGKQLIQEVYDKAKDTEFGGRIAFVEDYDMHMARYLVHGADVWLNNPEPLHEASGTSGQKAAINGALNLSVLDGWWSEGYNGKNGWAIHSNPETADSAERNRADASELYCLLEEEIIPLYYDRDINGVPHGWVQIIKEAIHSNVPRFSSRRMTKEYASELYLPAAEASQSMPAEVHT